MTEIRRYLITLANPEEFAVDCEARMVNQWWLPTSHHFNVHLAYSLQPK